MISEKYISQWNAFDGKRVRVKQLRDFFNQLHHDIGRNKIVKSMPYGVDLIGIHDRLKVTLASMDDSTVIQKLTVQKVAIKAKEKKQLTAVKPAPVKSNPLPVKQIVTVLPKKVAVLGAIPELKKRAEDISKIKASNKKITMAKEPKPVVNKRVETLPILKGVVGFEDLRRRKFIEIPLTGEYKEAFGTLCNDTQMMFHGPPGGGKTVFTLKFAQYLAEQMNMDTLYIAHEEFKRSTLTRKINQFNIGHPKLKAVRSLKALEESGKKIEDFQAVFFDSINSMKMDLDQYIEFVENHPGILYVIILQSTKAGSFKGGQDWEHEMDIAGKISNRKIQLHKNRYDDSFSEKSEKLLLEEEVNKASKKLEVRQKVKSKTTLSAPKMPDYEPEFYIPKMKVA